VYILVHRTFYVGRLFIDGGNSVQDIVLKTAPDEC
jgi:hypothetical protein